MLVVALLSVDELKRYSRQLILPNFGAREQRKLKQSKVVVTGAGGIGCPALYYLAACGVGNITIVDSDKIEANNLNRQILFTPADVGKPKAETAARRIMEFNPEIKVEAIEEIIMYDNCFELLKGFDAICDGTDNFPTRYAINDAAVVNKTPLFHAAALQFEGRVFTVIPGESACLRCMFPVIPPAGTIPSCREAGILGPVLGVASSVQAIECVKHLAGLGAKLGGRMIIFDARTVSFDEFKVKKNKNCTACGGKGFVPSPVEYKCEG